MRKQNGRFVNTFASPGTVVAYVRVSTDEQAASGAGLEAQRAAIEAEVARRGWVIVGWHADEGVSGSKSAEGDPISRVKAEELHGGRLALEGVRSPVDEFWRATI